MLSRCLSSLILKLVSFLSKYLGTPLHEYICFDRSVPFLKLGLTGFLIRFRQLHLLKGWNVLLLKARLPFQLQVVLIERVSIHIGVCSPISIEASGVYLVCNTTTEKYYDEEEYKKWALLRKRKRLDNLQFDGNRASPRQSGGSVVGKLSKFCLLFFIRRLKLSVRNVHLRLEDDCCGDSGEHIAAGVAVQSIVVKETPSDNVTRLEKYIEVNHMSVYWNTTANPEPLSPTLQASTVEKLKGFTFTDALGYGYVLRPSMMAVYLSMNQVNQSSLDVFLDAKCPAVKLTVSDDQLRSLVKFLSFIEAQAQLQHISMFRPSNSKPIRGEENARAWWQFAIRSVLYCLNEGRGRRLWDRIKLHRTLGTEYSELYSMTLTSAALCKKQTQRLQALEDEMDLLSVMVWRSKVWRGLKLRRLLVELSEHLSNKCTRVQASTEKTAKAFSWSFGGSFMCDSISVQLTEEKDNWSRSLLGLSGGDLRTSLSLQPLLRFDVSVQALELTGLAQNQDQPGPMLLQPSGEDCICDSRPLISLEFARATSSKSYGSGKTRGGRDPKASAEQNLFDYVVQLHLQPTVFVFDKGTAIEVCRVANVVIGSSNTHFETSVKEYSHAVRSEGKRRLEFVIKKELVSISADVHIPLLVLPSDSDKKRPVNAVLLNPGHLTISTSIVSEEVENPVVHYDVKLCETSLILSSQDECKWNQLVKHAAKMEGDSARELVSCREANVKLLAIVSLSKVEIDARVPTIKLRVSDTIIETSVFETASFADTLSELHSIATSVKNRKVNFPHHCKSDTILDSRIMEVADKIHSYSAPICKQALQGGTSSREKSRIQLALEIRKVFVELASGDGPTTHCLSGSVREVAVKLEYNNHDSWHGQVDLERASVEDTLSVRKEVSSIVKVVMTEYNVNKQFLTAGACVGSVFAMDPKIKNRIYVDMGPLDVFVSDKSLSVWTKVLARTCAHVSAINFRGLKSKKSVSSNKKRMTSAASRTALQTRTYEVEKGIIALSCTIFLKDVSVTLGSGSTPITRLSLSGIAVEMRDTLIAMESTGSVDSLCVLDTMQANAAGSPVISSNDLERVLKFKACIKRSVPGKDKSRTMLPSHSWTLLDSSYDVKMGADITVGGLSCQLLYKFVSAMQVYIKRIGKDLSSTMLALRSAKGSAPQCVAPPSKEPFKYHLSVNVHTTSLTIPGGTNSANLLELCVESLLFSNKYTIMELSGAGGESYYPLGEAVQFDFHQLSINRKDGENMFKLLSMPDARVSLSRIVSDAVPVQALNSEPYFNVSFKTDMLELNTSNRDLDAVLKIAHGNIGEAPADFKSDQLQAAVVSGELLTGEAHSQRVDGTPDVASDSEAARDEADHDSRGNKEQVQREVSKRNLLQLDVELKRLEWLASYLSDDNTRADSGSLQDSAFKDNALSTKLALDDVFATLSVDSDGCIDAEFWIMDLSLKEVPCSRDHRKTRATDGPRSSLVPDVYIIHQSLYYKKTKPPRLGGGTMDTRRSSSKDVVMQAALSYSKEDIRVCLTVQHIHMCVWSQLLNVGIKMAASSREKRSEQQSLKEDKQGMQRSQAASRLRWNVSLQLDNTSLALSDKPSNAKSYGMCAEVMTLHRGERNKLEVIFSSMEMRLSANPVHFSVCLVQFGQEMIKLTQVVKPCSVVALYHMKESALAADMEETVHVTLSKMIISISVEAIYAFVQPLTRAMEGVGKTSSQNETGMQPPSKKGLWEIEEMDKDWMLEVSKAHPHSSRTLQQTQAIVKKKQKANVELPEVVVHFDIISAGSSSSMLSLTVMAEAAAQSWSSDIVVDARFELSGFVYNRRVAAWEPLIEPTEDPVHDEFRRWEVIAKVRNISGVAAKDGEHILEAPGSVSSPRSDTPEARPLPNRIMSASDATAALLDRLDKNESEMEDVEEKDCDDDECFSEHVPQKTETIVVLITSDDRLEFTLTPGALETIFEIVKVSRQDGDTMEKHLAGCSYVEILPLQIRNETGLELSVYPGPTLAVGNSHFSVPISLPPSRDCTKCGPTASSAGTSAAPTMTPAASAAHSHMPLLRSESLAMRGSASSTPANLSVVSLSYTRADVREATSPAWGGGDGGEKQAFEAWNDYLFAGGFDASVDLGEGKGAYSSLVSLHSYLKKRKKQNSTDKEKQRELSGQGMTSWLHVLGNLNHKICVQAKGGMKSNPLSVTLPGRTPVLLYVPSFGGDGTGGGRTVIGVCDVNQEKEARVITLRSALQIKNEFPRTISLYAHGDDGTELISEVKPGETYCLPVPLFVAKTLLKLGVGPRRLFGEDVLDWSAMTKNLEEPVYISSPVGLSLSHTFCIQALMSTESAVMTVGMLNKSFYVLTLQPAFVIHNLLPVTVTIMLKLDDNLAGDAESKMTLAPGKMDHFLHINPTNEKEFTIEVPSYRGLHWKGKLTLDYSNSSNFHSRVKLESHNLKGERIDKMKIGVYSDLHVPAVHRLYAPYWLCNKTGLELEYEHQTSKRFGRGRKTLEGPADNSITLLYFKPDFNKKERKVKLRLAGSPHWSKEISLESTGQTESVVIKSNDKRSYELAVYNSDFTNILTSIVYVLQSVTICNSTKVLLQVSAHSEESSGVMEATCITLEPDQNKVFWSQSHKEVVIRMQDSSGQWASATRPFHLTRIGHLSLATSRAGLELPGVTVDINSDHDGASFAVTISPYVEGTAPYRIENMCTRHSIQVRQSSSVSGVSVPPGWRKLYVWDNPLLKWTLDWQVVGEDEHKWFPVTDGGSRTVDVLGNDDPSLTATAKPMMGNGKEVYWMVSYDGTQRVFQVFDNLQVCNLATKTSNLHSLSGASVESGQGSGAASLHVYCSMEGMGISLLNDKSTEVMYCSVSSSPAVWLKSSGPGAKFRILDDEQLLEAEVAWRTGEKEMQLGSETFNLDTLRGSRGATLMRSFNPGLWGALLVSSYHFTASAKFGRVQADNQLKYYVLDNRIVFAAEKVWDPEMLVAPSIEAGIVVRRPTTNQRVTVVENAYLKLKDMQINAELGLIAGIIPLIETLMPTETESQLYAINIEKALRPPSATHFKASTSASKLLFRNLSISPVKIAVTYSTTNEGANDSSIVVGRQMEILLQLTSTFSHGSVMISLDSLKFSSETSTAAQLYNVIYGHYKNEILSQLYSVILGLDLIGNPSNFIQNIDVGIKDLVEETMRGFEEDYTASEVVGVAVGVKLLLGHVVEGSVESLARSAGSFQSALLSATDLDYKRKRRQLQHETPETLVANIALGTRFFAQGLLGGLTDIFIKPITGAQSGGATGFIKGLGRGALSILAKPTLGVVDLAYFTLEGVRSFVDDDVAVQTVRLPRWVHPDKIVRPYRLHDAQGLNILWHNEDSEGTQYYGHHYLPAEDGKEARVLLINSLDMLQLKRGSKNFKVDDLNIKLEYMQRWLSETTPDGLTYLLITYGEDSTLEKIGSFFGIGQEDHSSELVKHISIQVDSTLTAEYLLARITAACEGVLAYYAVMFNS